MSCRHELEQIKDGHQVHINGFIFTNQQKCIQHSISHSGNIHKNTTV